MNPTEGQVRVDFSHESGEDPIPSLLISGRFSHRFGSRICRFEFLVLVVNACSQMESFDQMKLVGRIKSFEVSKGYGFIDCEDTWSEFGRDVFLHHQQLADFRPGDRVSFRLRVSAAGRPQALSLSRAQASELEDSPATHHGSVKWRSETQSFAFIDSAQISNTFIKGEFRGWMNDGRMVED